MQKRGGRPIGSPNKKKGLLSSGILKTEWFKIRCTPGFKEFVKMTADHEKLSESDVIHKCLQYYLTGSAWWIQGELFKRVQNEIW